MGIIVLLLLHNLLLLEESIVSLVMGVTEVTEVTEVMGVMEVDGNNTLWKISKTLRDLKFFYDMPVMYDVYFAIKKIYGSNIKII